MPNQLLNIAVKCSDNDKSLYRAEDMIIEITITNNHKTAIGFPLEFFKKTGPVIRLIDTRTRKDNYVHTGLANFDLIDKFTMIQPGKSLVVEEVIDSNYFRQFGGPYFDVSAEIIVFEKILVDGKHVDFKGRDTIQIVGKTPEGF